MFLLLNYFSLCDYFVALFRPSFSHSYCGFAPEDCLIYSFDLTSQSHTEAPRHAVRKGYELIWAIWSSSTHTTMWACTRVFRCHWDAGAASGTRKRGLVLSSRTLWPLKSPQRVPVDHGRREALPGGRPAPCYFPTFALDSLKFLHDITHPSFRLSSCKHLTFTENFYQKLPWPFYHDLSPHALIHLRKCSFYPEAIDLCDLSFSLTFIWGLQTSPK